MREDPVTDYAARRPARQGRDPVQVDTKYIVCGEGHLQRGQRVLDKHVTGQRLDGRRERYACSAEDGSKVVELRRPQFSAGFLEKIGAS